MPNVQTSFHFPVGYHHLHDDVSLNFQMNRWYNWVGDDTMLPEMRSIAPRIKTYANWKREFLALAEAALSRGATLKAAYYFRSAEFFMLASDPERRPIRKRFVELARSGYGITPSDLLAIPYRDGELTGSVPGYRFTPANPIDTVVLFGGFDSYIEEFVPMAWFFRDAGFDVVVFEGPGQGGALEDSGLKMTHEWEKPVAAVLDHLGLDNVTLMGLSLGGYLVLRAAAFEPRVKRVIADDIIWDFSAIGTRNLSPLARVLFDLSMNVHAAGVVNTMARSAAKRLYVVEWFLEQGAHVFGVRTPYEGFQVTKRYRAAEISGRVKQDVLLLAANRDHYVPFELLYPQAKALTEVRSLTVRVFTEAEQAQNHCQIGNIGLSLRVIADWIRLVLARDALHS